MDLSQYLTASLFVQAALAFYVAGFLVRDELLLRVLILVGTTLYILYYYHISDTPLWDAIWTSAVIGMTNIVMILVIWRERSTIGMSAAMLSLYRAFPTLYPGQFRQIMKHADWRTVEQPEVLCTKDEAFDKLYFITKGEVHLERAGGSNAIPANNFIGEISFLIGGNATATVIAPTGTEYVVWNRGDLDGMTKKSLKLSNALSALFNEDIARKLAQSAPEPRQPAADPDQSSGLPKHIH